MALLDGIVGETWEGRMISKSQLKPSTRRQDAQALGFLIHKHPALP